MKNISKTFLFIVSLVALMIGLTACGSDNDVKDKTNPVNEISAELTGSQDLKQFDDVSEMKTFLSLQGSNSEYDYYRGGVMMESVKSTGLTASATPAADNSAGSEDSGATDYSSTNVQVEGVDEADFVKNDDKYIYMIADNKLIIIDALKDKAEGSTIISETELIPKGDYYSQPIIKDIFLNGDKVLVFTEQYERTFYLEKYNIEPIETSRQNTIVYIYDVKDRTTPKVIDNYTMSGAYFDSRMIGNVVYVVSQEGLYYWEYYNGPMITYAKGVIRPKIYYFDNPEENYQMNTITSINIDTEEIVDSKSFMLGYSNTLMVSEKNIYIAYQKQRSWCWGWRCSSQNDDNKERFREVVVPLLEGDIKEQVTSILKKGLSEEEEWTEISDVFGKFYAELEKDEAMQDEYENMFENIEEALNEYDSKKALEESRTVIQKIAISDGQIEYKAKGEVDGSLLNQFSMDEYDENLRVATTVSIWLSKGSLRYNNVYVLDNNMDIVGSLENIAENESIYSTRFLGDKLFMVTFRQVDPFFVIDLENPKNPKVLGYLKIPGYSSYLHPISDTLIIGVGKETGENEWGGVSTKGVKVSLFDISDFNNPKEVDKYEIGQSETTSPVLYDHKAFMYSPTRKILVIPVTEIVEKTPAGTYNYINKVWNGAYVFNVSDKGFELAGKIKHSSSETQYYYWFNDATVRRSLYMDNYLYTISTKYVKINDLDNNLEEINSITLPYDKNNEYIAYD